MTLTYDPNFVFRDFVENLVPTSGAHKPRKLEIRAMLYQHHAAIMSLIADAGGLLLPNLLITCTITGGTANNITATANYTPPAPGLALFVIGIAQANTGPVILNGRPLLTNGMEQLGAGEIQPNDLLMFLDGGTHFRLLTDTGSLRNKQAALAAQIAAQGFRDQAEEHAEDAETSAIMADSAYRGIITGTVPFGPLVADGESRDFTLPIAPITAANIVVYIDGLAQGYDARSLIGTTLRFSQPPPAGSRIWGHILSLPEEVGVLETGSVTADSIDPGAVVSLRDLLLGDTLDDYITADSTDTLTNKTFNAAGTGNSLANVNTTHFAANIIDPDPTLDADSDLRVPTQKAVKAAIAGSAFPNGMVLGSAMASYTTNADITTVMPLDDTIPQNTEGVEILTVTITPKSTSNKLRVRFRGQVSSSNIAHATAALFVGSTAGAIAGVYASIPANAYGVPITLEHEFVPGVTTAVTLKIRIGPANSSPAIRLNGNASSRMLGGVSAATLVVEEIKA